MYTLAPLATGTQCIAAAIDLVVHVSQDKRYAGKRIVLMGDSAGGWIVLRLALALTELALGKGIPELKEVKGLKRDSIKAAREKLYALVMISPLVDCEMFDEDTEKACTTVSPRIISR
jgi:acetyl esterase/lipase